MYRIDYRGYLVTVECTNIDINDKLAGWTASARIAARDAPTGLIVRVPGRYPSERDALTAGLREVQIRLVQVENEATTASHDARRRQAGITSSRGEGRLSCRTSSCVTRDAKP